MQPPLVSPGSLVDQSKESEPALTFALYVNGRLVPCDRFERHTEADGVTVTVTMRTTIMGLAVGDGDPRIERAWGAKKAGEFWQVRFGEKNPPTGVVVIEDVIVPDIEGEEAQFRCTAQTDIYDWTDTTPIARATTKITLPEHCFYKKA